MAWTQTDAQLFRRALAGLNPHNHNTARPSAQDTYDCLVALLTRAFKAYQTQIRDSDREELRQLVDDLYRVEAQPGPAVAVVSWDYDESPDMDELVKAITQVGAGQVYAREVDDGSQECILAVSRQPLDDDAALAAWEATR